MDFSQKAVRAVLRTYLEDSYLDGSCLPLALAAWRRPRLCLRLLACRPVPVSGRYPALYGLLLTLLRQYGAKACADTDALLTACCRIRPLTVYELRQLPLFLQAAALAWGGKLSVSCRDFEERHSIVHRLLSEEPAGIYPHLSADGRAECRRMVAEQARRQNRSETAVAADVTARAFRGGSHAAAVLLSERQHRQDTVQKGLKTAAVCTAGIVAVWGCAVLDRPWLLPLAWGALLGAFLPLSRFAAQLYLPPCRHLPFGRISPPAVTHAPPSREYRHIHPDTPHAALFSGGAYALLLTDAGASYAYYRRRALTDAEEDSLLHPTGVFFTVSGDADACLTAAPFYRETAACSAVFEPRCARYAYSGAALDGTVTVSVHPGGFGDVRTLTLHNRTPQPLHLTVCVSLPFSGVLTPDPRSGLTFCRKKQGGPLVGVGFADETEAAYQADGIRFALCLPTGGTARYDLLTAVGTSREEVRCAFGALRENAALMPDAGAQSALPVRFSDRVLPHLIGPPDCGHTVRRAVAESTASPAALRRFGVRPTLPYILLTAHNAADAVRLAPYLRGLHTLHRLGIPCGTVITAPDEPTLHAVKEVVRHSECLPLCGTRGVIRFVCRPTEPQLNLLTAYAAYDAAQGASRLKRLPVRFSPLFFQDGALFVRVDNTVRPQGRIGDLLVEVQNGAVRLINDSAQPITCETALLVAPVGRRATVEKGVHSITLRDGQRCISISEPNGVVGFICRRTAFYEGAWVPEPYLPCAYPCAVIVCRRTVPAGQTLSVRLKIRVNPS